MPQFSKFNIRSKDYEALPTADSEKDQHGSRSSEESDVPLMEGELNGAKKISRVQRAFTTFKEAMKSPMFIISFLLFQIGVSSLFLAWQHSHRFNARLKDISMHSPVLDKIEIPLVLRKSYAQYGMGGPEIWRAEPSEEVDKAWERDPGVYLFRWMEEFNRPIADTNIWRKCWDFESVLQEHNELAVKDMMETDVRKPNGVKTVPAPEGVMKIIRNYQKTHPDYNPGQ
ncbi:hypothetical protein CGCA056_v011062 [Colletotrichum aenigma]|uniref:uncharacterized protein n=1 Tax=Colletotrichum aenigma TaxID=1215731 RepID=UPI0018728ABB|nr:uncharacterized protein CGCA056_v011062 [Colletotrichum aenigma]KAF5517661.1 hypothetical protein CGCA056_v011062 [Colletotrichum aenigma]